MKKQKIALFLSLTWLIGMIAVFSFPPNLERIGQGTAGHASIQKVSSPDLQLRSTSGSLEVPPFKVDWRLDAFLHPAYCVVFFTVYPIYLASSFYSGSGPLFDVLITFFHFFYTW